MVTSLLTLVWLVLSMCSLFWFPDIVVHCQKSEYRGVILLSGQ
jgi:hypothetical protein